MVWDQYVRVNGLPCDRVSWPTHLEMLRDHLFLIGMPALNDDWLLHELVCDRTFEEIGHVERPVVNICVKVLVKVYVSVERVFHLGCLLGLVGVLQVAISFHFLLQVDHYGCLVVRF